LSETDKRRDESKAQSGFGKKVSNWLGRELVYPTNVLYGATECSYRNHSAVFPYWLPEWFIKLFTDPGDVVLDPFLGSGTTAVAARNLGRWYVGIDTNEEYCFEAKRALLENQRKGNNKNVGHSKNSGLHKSEHRWLPFEEAREPQEIKT
jgi:DNA modification methylase